MNCVKFGLTESENKQSLSAATILLSFVFLFQSSNYSFAKNSIEELNRIEFFKTQLRLE